MLYKSLRVLPVLMLGLASPALAAEGGLLTPSGGLIFWTILTFVIVLVTLWKFAWPHILGAVEAREAHVRDLIAAAAADRAEAQRLLEEQQRQLEEARARMQEVMAESRTAGERLREEMLAETRREQALLISRAEREIEQATERAVEEVRAEAVDLAIAAAERLISRNLSTEDNRRLVREYIDQVGAPSGAPVAAGV